MRFQVMSDLHLEHHMDGGTEFLRKIPVAADTLVVAGDLTNDQLLEETLIHMCYLWKNVVYVFGNHELYGSYFDWVRRTISEAKEECSNLHVLDNSTAVVDGQRFVGTTMWFPDVPEARVRKNLLNDFSHIRDFEGCVYQENDKARAFLRENVKKGDVVVTHHMPTSRFVADRHRGSPLEPYFLCDMEALIVERSPAVWVFGHTHTAGEATFFDTRLVWNPFGYPYEETGFNETLVVEI